MKIGCVILAGGKSSRMGEDKALLEFEGKNFIEKIAAELSFFEEKMIARGNNSELQELGDFLWRIISDIYPDHGPIGGLHAALKECDSDALFCVSCDIPMIKRELAKKLCDVLLEDKIKGKSFDAVIAVTDDGKYHPLCGIYRKNLYKLMEEHLMEDNNRLMAVLKKSSTHYVSLDKETSKQLLNVNTRDDYNHLSGGHLDFKL